MLAGLLLTFLIAIRGYATHRPFRRGDDRLRALTVTLSHIQLLLGILIYTQSPVTRYFWAHLGAAIHERYYLFFGFLHMAFMVTAIGVLTTGSALANRPYFKLSL